MTKADYKSAVSKRETAWDAILRIQDYVANLPPTATVEEIQDRFDHLEAKWLAFEEHSAEAEVHATDVQSEKTAHVASENTYFGLKAKLKKLIRDRTPSTSRVSATTSASGNVVVQAHVPQEVKLQPLQLPTFDGNLLEWQSFQDLFVNTIDKKTGLSDSHKLQYLKTSLRGDALKLIQSVEVTDANYASAWATLRTRYHDVDMLIEAQVNRLRALPTFSRATSSCLTEFADQINESVRCLRQLNPTSVHWDQLLIIILKDKLDVSTKQWWIDHKQRRRSGSNSPTIADFTEFLIARAKVLHVCVGTLDSSQPSTSKFVKPTSSRVHAVTKSCMCCNGDNHALYQCGKFNKMSTEERKAFVSKRKLCFNCLRDGHTSNQCNSSSRCKSCKNSHHSMLHFDRNSPRNVYDEDTVLQANTCRLRQSSGVLLATAIIDVQDAAGSWKTCRAFLDNGAQASFISRDCVSRLGLRCQDANMSVSGFGGSTSVATQSVCLRVRSRWNKSTLPTFKAFVVSKVTASLPTTPVDSSTFHHVQDLELADPTFHKPGRIDILLSASVFARILLPAKRDGKGNQPVAISTTLGWIVTGEYEVHTSPVHALSVVTMPSLDDLVTRFWEVEGLPVAKFQSQEHQRCVEHFESTYTRDLLIRFVVKLPFKDNVAKLGTSRHQAVSRFKALEKKLDRDPALKEACHQFMDEYLSLDHMEEVKTASPAQDQRPVYLPYHMVFKESSSTTKVRVVFDGSCKTSTGISLNQTLMTGPTIQADLVSILVKFRTHPIALTADLEKMYRMIRVAEEDRDYQRIVWRKKPDEPLKDFRLCTVTYGTTSAPYLAIQCLRKLAELEHQTHPLASAATLSDFYVDDFVSGAACVEDAKLLCQDMVAMTGKANFKLRKWASNSSDVLSVIPPELREVDSNIDFDSAKNLKTLGITWDHANDLFMFCDSAKPPAVFTKRHLLSDISKVFDPLGWLSPVTIRAKVLIQGLWRLKVGWDDNLPPEVIDSWKHYRSSLPDVKNIRIPRYIGQESTITYDLHGFADASEKAYAACVYLRSCSVSGNIKCVLVAAKTKVAPLDKLSIPRLELCAAVLLCRLVSSVKDALCLPITGLYAWTDSTVALHWILSPSFTWHTFVANRTSEIQRTIPASQWHHVPTADNPADCASRGIEVQDLANHHLWWNGPSWLCGDDIPFRKPTKDSSDAVDKERKPDRPIACVVTTTTWLSNFSSLSSLIRITALVLRFKNNCRKGTVKLFGSITVSELKYAKCVILKCVQAECFASEIKCLSIDLPIPKSSPLIKLNPFLEKESGLLRVGGRLQKASIPFGRKHPIILPTKHHFVTLLVRSVHLTHLHCGPTLLVNALASEYWILRVRDAARSCVHKCVTCFKYKSEASAQLMGNLPSLRVNVARPFTTTGVDYAGPFEIKDRKGRGSKKSKVYFCIFICFVTHAIHLELVSDMTSEAFIAALRRFVSTRGRPATIFSDCGTNFVGAVKEMKRLQSIINSAPSTASFLVNQGIEWKFNPPSSPHFGGLWEAGVKSVKHHLRRCIGLNVLTFEEFFTVLKQIEACLNSRPLTPRSMEPDDLEPLTPGHFLVGAPLTSAPDEDVLSVPINRLTRWQHLQHMVQGFWKRWQAEYLSRLQTRPKWWHVKKIKIGDLVLLKEPQQPLSWELGRIINLYPGSDGHPRVADVKTASALRKRPINKLCILPLDHD